MELHGRGTIDLLSQMIELIHGGMSSASDIAQELGKAKGTISKWAKEAADEGKIRISNGHYLPALAQEDTARQLAQATAAAADAAPAAANGCTADLEEREVRHRVRSRCRFVLPRINFMRYSLTCSVPLYLKRRCDRTLGQARHLAAPLRRGRMGNG